jgi:hypothetical protein
MADTFNSQQCIIDCNHEWCSAFNGRMFHLVAVFFLDTVVFFAGTFLTDGFLAVAFFVTGFLGAVDDFFIVGAFFFGAVFVTVFFTGAVGFFLVTVFFKLVIFFLEATFFTGFGLLASSKPFLKSGDSLYEFFTKIRNETF